MILPKPPRIPRKLEKHPNALESGQRYCEVSLSGSAADAIRLDRVRVESANWQGDIKGLDALDTVFARCFFPGVNLERGIFTRVEFRDCRLTGMQLPEAHFHDVLFQNCHLNLAGFRFAEFKNCLFRQCQLEEADFGSASFHKTAFRDCQLARAEFFSAALDGVDLRGCELEGLKVRPEDLRGAVIDRPQLVGFAPDMARILGLKIED